MDASFQYVKFRHAGVFIQRKRRFMPNLFTFPLLELSRILRQKSNGIHQPKSFFFSAFLADVILFSPSVPFWFSAVYPHILHRLFHKNVENCGKFVDICGQFL